MAIWQPDDLDQPYACLAIPVRAHLDGHRLAP
jgi:hypothetical protein